MALKVLQGSDTADRDIAPPETLELISNRSMTEHPGLKLPGQIWRIANSVVN